MFPRVQHLLARRLIHTSRCHRGGYIVLIPEIGEDSETATALLNPDGLPKFNNVMVENCLANIGKQAGTVEKIVKDVEKTILEKSEIDVQEDILKPLELATSDLEVIWGISKTLYYGNNTLMPTKYYLNIHDRAKRARASRFNNATIYNFLKKVNKENLDASEKRVVDKYLLECKLNGVSLSEKDKITLNKVLNDLSEERTKFRNNVDIAKRQFSHTIQKYSLVRNFPSELLSSVSADPNHPTNGPWKITLQPQIVHGFLKYCPDRNERWNVWQADTRKASGLTDKNVNNSVHLENVRSLRKRQANLLGYPDFATMSMETKMTKSLESVKSLFETLIKSVKPAQAKELEMLQDFAIKNGFNHNLELFDIPYWKRKYLQAEYNIDEESLREYFPLPHVVDSIMDLCENLFQLKFVERNVDVWNPSVKFYDVFDKAVSEKPIAGLYLDISINQRTFGTMVSIKNRSIVAGTKPLAALVHNFGTSVPSEKSYLLTVNDLKSLMKNFGTTLQHLLSRAKYSDIAGLSNIEWDAAELCGYVMINFLEDKSILKLLSEEPLPEELENSVKIYNNHMAGLELSRQMYLSHLDLELYSTKDFWMDIVKRLWPIYMNFKLEKKDVYECCSMTDIVSGDWGAAYFSHLYAKMIAADISNSFDDTKSNTDLKKRFRDLFLFNDGSLAMTEIFRRYRGRDPSPKSLLKRLNIDH